MNNWLQYVRSIVANVEESSYYQSVKSTLTKWSSTLHNYTISHQASVLLFLSSFFVYLLKRFVFCGRYCPAFLMGPDVMKGKFVIITGANAGLGKETALQLAQLGTSTIVLAVRNAKRGLKARNYILKQLKMMRKVSRQDENFSYLLNSIHVVECDLDSLESVRDFVSTLQILFCGNPQMKTNQIGASAENQQPLLNQERRCHPMIDVLINNCGIVSQQHDVSKNGVEKDFAVNFLGE